MEPTETSTPTTPAGRDRLNSRIVAVGAALGLTLAGLGMAGAQTAPPPATPESTGQSAPAHEPGRHKGSGCHRGGARAVLSVAAGAIGISEADLRAAMRSGRSIAQVAESKDVPVKKVIDALVTDAEKRLAAKVEAGEVTQAQADRRSSRLEERFTALVNRVRGDRPGHPSRPRAGSTPDRQPPPEALRGSH